MCRYRFGKFFTEKTIVARPLPDTISDETNKNASDNDFQIHLKCKTNQFFYK